MSNSQNRKDSSGPTGEAGIWVREGSNNSYDPAELREAAPETPNANEWAVKYSSVNAGQYLTTGISTAATRKQEKLLRLNQQFKKLSKAF